MGDLAERIRVPNRAQTLNFSLASVALVRSATQLATGVAGKMSQAIGFDEILQRTPTEAVGEEIPSAKASAADLKKRLTDSIRSELAKRSIHLNQRLELRVHPDGSLRVDGNPPRGAEIEALLNSGSEAGRLAQELVRASGSNQISIDLTSSGAPENMVGPGGYPNW